MTERKELGKIKKISIGIGGYQDAQIGISIELGGTSWSVGQFYGFWSGKRSSVCKWSEEDRVKALGETMLELNKWLKQAGANDVSELNGKPVEITFDGNSMKSWRLLTEVL